MTIGQIIKRLNAIKPHQYDDETVLSWITELEAAIFNDVLKWHGEAVAPERRTKEDMSADVLVPDGYESVYTLYLIAQIDYANGEIGRYNNSMTMANAAFENWAGTYNRQNRPLQPQYVRGAR